MSFDPYYQWLGIPPKDQPPDHYRLLALEPFEPNLDVIDNAADRQMAHVRTFQAGNHSAESQRLLNEISAARVCLFNPDRKAAYDATMRARQAAVVAQATVATPSAALGPGTVLGGYELLERVGTGVMGDVFKAVHRRMGRIVAIKVLKPAVIHSPEVVRRFEREIKATAMLSHPNLVAALDAAEDQGHHYLVMEFVPGLDLATMLQQQGPLSVTRALDTMIQVAQGLEYAHARGVVHRNIKPGNLLVALDGAVKLLDLGLARIDETAGDGEPLTREGVALGTVDYMALEQAQDARHADPRSDIYSLGCTLYRVLTGRPPYDGRNLVLKMLAHREQPIPSLAAARPDLPPALDGVFQRMLAKDPRERFQSMTDVIRALEACRAQDAMQQGGKALVRPIPISGMPPAPSSPATTSSRMVAKHQRSVSRQHQVLLIACATALAVVAAAAMALWLIR